MCVHGRLLCSECQHTASAMDVTQYFANQLGDIYLSRTAGARTFSGVLAEYKMVMDIIEKG